MSGLERDGIKKYFDANLAFTPVEQLPLGTITKQATPDFGLTGVPTKSLLDVFGEDFVPAVGLMRKIYVPFYSPAEYDILMWSSNWLNQNRDNFDKTVLKGVGFENVQIQVLFFWHTLSLLTLFKDGVGRKDVREYNAPIAFSPGDSGFEKDIRKLTLPYYDYFRGQRLAMGKQANYRDINSTSRFAYLMTRFFWSGGDEYDEYAIDAADIVTRNIFIGYFLSLKLRIRVTLPFLVNSGRSKVV